MTRKPPLVIRRGSKSKVQTYWQFRSCRCILIHAAMVTYGQQRNGGRLSGAGPLLVDEHVDQAAERIADIKPAHLPRLACRPVLHREPERADPAQRKAGGGFGVPVVTCLRAFFHCTQGCGCVVASGLPCALVWRVNVLQNSGRSCRENVDVRPLAFAFVIPARRASVEPRIQNHIRACGLPHSRKIKRRARRLP